MGTVKISSSLALAFDGGMGGVREVCTERSEGAA